MAYDRRDSLATVGIELIDLNHRANFQVLSGVDVPVVLYEDHRSILVALWHARRKEIFEEPRTLITFDLHDDCKSPRPEARERALSFRDGAGDERDFFSFVEWDLSVLDDDWVTIAMDLNLVKDVVNIGAEHHSNLEGLQTEIADQAGTKHNVWRIPHLWDAMRGHGDLVDRARSGELKGLWDALYWQPTSLGVHHDGRFILDFDLDCFSMQGPHERRLAWPSDIMVNLFRSKEAHDKPSAEDVLRQIMEQSDFVTIARESPYCGGVAESDQILATLDEVLFGGRLLARGRV